VTNNIDFVLRVLFAGAPIRAQKLDEFFAASYNLLSDQKSLPSITFKSLYHQLIVEDSLYDFEEYSNFIAETYPLLSDLLGSFSESRFFNLTPTFNYFTYTCPPGDSFMKEEMAFGLYLTNPLFCKRRKVRLYPIYSSYNIPNSSTDVLSHLISIEAARCRCAVLRSGPVGAGQPLRSQRARKKAKGRPDR
jgi:hypothetical protein